MNCLEAQRLMRPFLENQINDQTLEDFIDHIESCDSCREELELNLAVFCTLEQSQQQGTARDSLRTGEGNTEFDNEDYNFPRKLEKRLQKARRSLQRNRLSRFLKAGIALVSGMFLVFVLFVSVRMYLDQDKEDALLKALGIYPRIDVVLTQMEDLPMPEGEKAQVQLAIGNLAEPDQPAAGDEPVQGQSSDGGVELAIQPAVNVPGPEAGSLQDKRTPEQTLVQDLVTDGGERVKQSTGEKAGLSQPETTAPVLITPVQVDEEVPNIAAGHPSGDHTADLPQEIPGMAAQPESVGGKT